MKYFVQQETITSDDEVCIVRTASASLEEARSEAYSLACYLFGDDKCANCQWLNGEAGVRWFKNDLGLWTRIFAIEFGNAAQVTEGRFVL